MKCTDCKHWFCDYDLEEKPADGEPLRCQQDWEYCVSTASSFMSANWEEHFFSTEDEADAYERKARKLGKATLKVAKEEY